MADETGNEDRTEDATPERREEFRERGQVAFSRDLASVISMACLIYVMFYWWKFAPKLVIEFTKKFWSSENNIRPSLENIGGLLSDASFIFLKITVPLFVVIGISYGFVVVGQTRFNFSWEKINFDAAKLNPISGFVKIFSMQSVVELLKSIGKLLVVGSVAYLVLVSEWKRIPVLMHLPFGVSWKYWGLITKDLFTAVIWLLLAISLFDYFYQYMTLEKQLKMTKEEVKQEYKQREVDPHVRNKIRRMQRENVSRNKVARTRKATVLVTNPTHYSIALKYEIGINAPILLAKGEDETALRMRLVAKEENIPIVENKKLARALYSQVEEGEEIPSKFYAAVAEVIRYVYRLTGKKIPQKRKQMVENNLI